MARTDSDMTQGAIWRHLLQFSLPMAVGLLFQQLYNTVDTVVVGQFVGKEAQAAVGSTGAIINTIVGFCAGLATGASVIISQRYGAHDHKGLSKAVNTTIALTFLMSVLATVVGQLIIDPMLRFMQTPDNVMDEAHAYLDDAAVDGDGNKAEGSFPSELFGRGCRRLAKDVFAKAAHDHHQADDHSEKSLESLVADADQKANADTCSNDSGNQELEENFLVEVAVTGEICNGADVSDDKSDSVGAVCHRGRHAKEYHDGEAERAATTGDAVDEANDCAQDKEDRILSVFPPGGIYHFASSFCKKSLLSMTFCFWL